MELYEGVSGARVHAAFYRPGSVNHLLDPVMRKNIIDFSGNFFSFLSTLSGLLNDSVVWKKRLINTGTLGWAVARSYGLTGVMLRSTGIKKDVRTSKRSTYGSYIWGGLSSFVATNGDSFDRYNLRMAEMHESTLLVHKLLTLPVAGGDRHSGRYKIFYGNQNNRVLAETKVSMEHLIRHFKVWSEGELLESGHSIQTVESPKGELTVTVFANGTAKAEKCKVKSPAYNNLQLLNKLSRGLFLTDLVTLIGTIDIVFGEIDR